jgi:hypothetical protein
VDFTGVSSGGEGEESIIRSRSDDTQLVVQQRHEHITPSQPWTLLGSYLAETATSRAGTGGLDGWALMGWTPPDGI